MSFDLATLWTDDQRPHAIRPERADLKSAITTKVPVGKRLSELSPDKPRRWKSRTAIGLGRRVAESLQLIHAAGRAHGHITPEQVWCSPPSTFHLLWTPTEKDVDDSSQGVAGDLGDLGRLLFELRHRTPPPKHDEGLPANLMRAVRDAPRSDPLDRILAHLLSGNPEARFASAEQLARALSVAESMLRPPGDRPAKTVPATPEVRAVPVTAPQPPPTQPTASQPPSPALPSPKPAAPPPTSPPRRLRRRRSPVPVVAGMLAIPLLCLAIVLITRGGGDSDSSTKVVQRRVLPDGKIPPVVRSSTKNTPNSSTRSGATRGNRFASDGPWLWAPPRARSPVGDFDDGAGGAFSLSTLPPGPGAVLHWDTEAWQSDPGGRAILEALSPELQSLIDRIPARCGVPIGAVADVTICLHPGSGGSPENTLTIQLKEPIDRAEWESVTGASAARTADGKTVYAADDAAGIDADVFYLAESDDPVLTRFAVGPAQRISDIAAMDGDPIPLSRPLETLWKSARRDSDLTLLVTPNFLVTDARAYLRALIPRGEAAVRRWLVPDVGAAALGYQSDGALTYVEARFTPGGGLNETELMSRIDRRIRALPVAAEDFLIAAQPDRSWKALAIRLPRMWDFVADQTRIGLIDRQVVVNAYLPTTAMPQLTLASLLAMNTPVSAPVVTTETVRDTPLTLTEMLDRPMSIAIDQESLESAVELIAEEFRGGLPAGSRLPPIEIQGNDLRLMGITQNQQIRDFRFTDEPLRNVLTKLMLAANPDRTATGPSDPKQALVWVTTSGPPKILVTTRPVASERYELPPEFRSGR